MAAPFIPQVLVFTDFLQSSVATATPLRACIVGPHAQLVRHGVASEKADGLLGAYDSGSDTLYDWPNLAGGGIVDLPYARLFLEDAELGFYSNLANADETVAPVAGRPNRISITGSAGFARTATTSRLSGLYGRDVQLGDRVRVRATISNVTYTHDSYVTGLVGDAVAAALGTASNDPGNLATRSASAVTTQTAGSTNSNSASGDVTNYNGLPSGYPSDTYTITVIQGSVGSDPTTALVSVKSASGLDDVASVAPAAYDSFKTVGSRGFRFKFTFATSASDLVIGQTWQCAAVQAFTATVGTFAGTYVGSADDTYIVTVTRGGLLADADPNKRPQWVVTTARGTDASGAFTPAAANTAYAIGTQGLTFKVATGTTALAPGDRFYQPVTAATTGRLGTLALADALPGALQSASDLDLFLYTRKTIEVDYRKLGYDPLLNYSASSSGITVYGGMVAHDPDFVDDASAPIGLTVLGGTLYAQYRAWLPDLSDAVGLCSDTAALSTQIDGSLDPDNPLAWGVYKALANSNGVGVKYIGVSDPADPDSWASSLAYLVGDDEIYNVVPLSQDPTVFDLVTAQVLNLSTPEKGFERATFLGMAASPSVQRVGPSTSSDHAVVLATLADDPDAAGTQYTLLTITSGNAQLIASGVKAGDKVRYNYTTSYGRSVYAEYPISAVLSQTTLRLRTGASAPASIGQRVEIWHSRTNDEIVADLESRAAAYSSTRVCAVFTDLLSPTNPATDVAYLAAALGGLASGVFPHQPLTNVTISGFADVMSAKGYLNGDQVATLCGNGVWTVSRVANVASDAIITRLATTTATAPLSAREEMIRRNTDELAKGIRNTLAQFLGNTNVTPTAASMIRVQVDAYHESKKTPTSDRLGGQLIDVADVSIAPHVLFADRYVINATWTIPAPLNTIEFHAGIVVS